MRHLINESLQHEIHANSMFGLLEYIDKNGNIQSEENYINGLGNGKTITYHQNGQVKSKGKYLNGKAVGKWFWWNGCIQSYC